MTAQQARALMNHTPYHEGWTEAAELRRIFEIIDEDARHDKDRVWLGPIREGNIEKLKQEGFKVQPTWDSMDPSLVIGFWIQW